MQNKDELRIPLELAMIPTPKEFKDAISSLSPEMQAFAKSFRAMQRLKSNAWELPSEAAIEVGKHPLRCSRDPDQAATGAFAESDGG